MSDKKIVIEMVLKQATSLDDFKAANGKAEMRKPYYVDHGGAMVFEYINEKTDRAKLEDQIERNLVWIMDGDVSVRG